MSLLLYPLSYRPAKPNLAYSTPSVRAHPGAEPHVRLERRIDLPSTRSESLRFQSSLKCAGFLKDSRSFQKSHTLQSQKGALERTPANPHERLPLSYLDKTVIACGLLIEYGEPEACL